MTHARKAFLILCLVLPLTACAGSPTFLTPASSVSAKESNLYQTILWMAVGVFVIVESLLVYNIVRFRRRTDDDSLPPQIYGNTRLEVVWTLVPVVLVGLLFTFTFNTMRDLEPPAPSPADVHVTVFGHRWWWEFDYPDQGIITANELHVPVGVPIRLQVESVDVIHSFWIPQVSGKVDAIPGQTNELWFQADTLGEYHGQCAEFCGLNHANMRIKLVVESQADFKAWVANQQKPAAEPQNDLQAKGQKIILSGICQNCHTLGDHKALNNVGPNLTHLMSRSVFAGATFDLNEANLHNWLLHNKQMKPGNDMTITISNSDANALMAYLVTLK